MESVASMSAEDEQVMTESFGEEPWSIDAVHLSLARRPRLYWVDWELSGGDGVSWCWNDQGRAEVVLTANVTAKSYLRPGWTKCSEEKFPTFTTSRPRTQPGYKPAGVKQCTPSELSRWKDDAYRFPPYQYRDQFAVQNKAGIKRILDISEREVIMGFPCDYTSQCLPKSRQVGQAYIDERLTLVGNSWSVPVVAWLMSQLGQLVGLNDPMAVQEVVQRTSPGCTKDFLTFLQRPAMQKTQSPNPSPQCEEVLVKKLLTMGSLKGEDLMLQTSSDEPVKYQRLRASIPARLWKWKTVASWRWLGKREHINVLELRAVLTSLRWRIERQRRLRTKFVHLVDSLVCLHALSRGRSSSQKLKRTLLRTNALLLVSKTQALWAYAHTKQNPADAPSRHPRKRKWGHA